jgi:hypothetical protein
MMGSFGTGWTPRSIEDGPIELPHRLETYDTTIVDNRNCFGTESTYVLPLGCAERGDGIHFDLSIDRG